LIYDDFDDVLFGMNVLVKAKIPNEAAMQSCWDKEDEKVKRKLERISINSIKYKYA
jgi:hypothetical protein